jgi:ATP-binding cassette subfamily F protein uup
VAKLSGGERRRLQLLKVLVGNPNFLILDEPTNDLDIDTLNILEDFLVGFDGCLLLVSHDRYFMDKLVEHLFVFQENGNILDYYGNYTDYREEVDNLPATPEAAPKIAETKSVEAPVAKKKLSFKEQKELETIEKEIETLEARKTELNTLLVSGTTDHVVLTQWADEIADLDKLISRKSDRWLELSEI